MAIKRKEINGYGQLEPNRIAAQRTKEVFAQLPAAATLPIIENGMFLVYDLGKDEVRLPSVKGEYAQLVMNEINLADERYQEDKDYAMIAHPESNYQVAMAAYPRLFNPKIGDTFTTNVFKWDEANETSPNDLVGTKYTTDIDGIITPIESGDVAQIVFVVVKQYTMPDGQYAMKFAVEKIDQGAE